jgi:hypothetical protein
VNSYPISGVSNSSSTSIINGTLSKQISKTYTFVPLKSTTIPSYKVFIDSKEYTTKPKKISVLKPTQSKNGDEFKVELSVGDNKLRVGQSTKLIVKFKHKLNAQAQRINLSEPEIDNFWIKKIEGIKKYNQNDYIVQEFAYLITAQKSGIFHIPALQANIGVAKRQRNSMFNDAFFSSFASSLRWKKVYSNELEVEVKALPEGLEVYGSFDIKVSVDKKETKPNKPINLTININGKGNLEDIKKFELDIDGAIIYSDEPKVKSSLVNGELSGSFTQKIAIISDKDFTIPSIKFKYFDKKSQNVKIVSTQPIRIKIENSNNINYNQNSSKRLEIDTNDKSIAEVKVVEKSNHLLESIYFVVGILVGVFGAVIVMKKNNSKNINSSSHTIHITKQIQKAKDDKTLYEILLPYANDADVIKDTLKLLEENIYKNNNHQINKQDLYDYFL